MWSNVLWALSSLSVLQVSTALSTQLKAEPQIRALPNAPNGYIPTLEKCPSTAPSVRTASSLSQDEVDWLQKRRNITVPALQDVISRIGISDFDVDSYYSKYASDPSQLPNLAIAFSGGGWRALMNGAGALSAFDNRTASSTDDGHLGGLLQASTYIAGLSGGSWLVGSIYINNFSTVDSLQHSGNVWQFQNSVLEGPPSSGIQLLNTVGYYEDLEDAASGKAHAGFETSLTDYWARGLSYQLVNATSGGPSYTWSSIAASQNFIQADVPLPLIISDERAPGEMLIPGNTTIYEINPFEFGSWDPTLYGMIPLEYIGSNFTSGKITNTSACVRGFDNAGFMMGTSSSLFNQIILEALNGNSSLPGFLTDAIQSVANDIGANNDDIAEYKPNPFYHYNLAENPNANTTTLTLVDGGEDNQNIPFHPLIQPNRNVDVILAVDSSADTSTNWPNGSALVQTYQRTSAAISNGTGFPSIPDTNTMINLGLNTHPTFFGCNASNFSTAVPLVVYIPSSPYSAYSNVSTFQLSYTEGQRDDIIENGYNVATMANGTADSSWSTCLACAIMSRSFDRTQTTVPSNCTTCFDRYCWNGTLDDTTPATYEPKAQLNGTAPPAATAKGAASTMSSPFGFVGFSVFVWGVVLSL